MPAKRGYKAVLFSPDGKDYVTDYAAPTVEEVWENVNNGGSRWFFYPLPVVIRDTGSVTMRQRVVSDPDMLDDVEGLALSTVARYIADNQSLARVRAER